MLNEKELIAKSNNENLNCVPMTKWQTTSHPTCNLFHEMDFPQWHPSSTKTNNDISENDYDGNDDNPLLYLGEGNYRIPFKALSILFDATTFNNHTFFHLRMIMLIARMIVRGKSRS